MRSKKETEDILISLGFLMTHVGFLIEDIEIAQVDLDSVPKYKDVVRFYEIAKEKLEKRNK